MSVIQPQVGCGCIDGHLSGGVIAECDENLCGTKLTAAERALFTRRRKEAHEALHPETKGGHAGAAAKWDASDKLSFASDPASKTGQARLGCLLRLPVCGIARGQNRSRRRNIPKPKRGVNPL